MGQYCNIYAVTITFARCMEMYVRKEDIIATQFGVDCLQMVCGYFKDTRRKCFLNVLVRNGCFISVSTGYDKSQSSYLFICLCICYYRRYANIF